jgi:AraC-like DNA-binding protein
MKGDHLKPAFYEIFSSGEAGMILYRGHRNNFIVNICKNKRVVHIGCNDWPYQNEQIAKNNLLHLLLVEVANEILGVDVDIKGINELKSLRGVSSEYLAGDFTLDHEVYSEIVNFEPSIILVPDVLEHLQNQKIFLDSLFRLQQDTQSKVLISTPNSNSLKTFLPLLLRIDFTHPDHRLLHNEVTLMKVIAESGFNHIEIFGCQRNISKKYGMTLEAFSKPINIFARVFPQFTDTLIITSDVS